MYVHMQVCVCVCNRAGFIPLSIPPSPCISDIQLPPWRKHLKKGLRSNCDTPGQDVAERGEGGVGVILLSHTREKFEDSYSHLYLILEIETHSRWPLVKARRSRPHTWTSYLRESLRENHNSRNDTPKPDQHDAHHVERSSCKSAGVQPAGKYHL